MSNSACIVRRNPSGAGRHAGNSARSFATIPSGRHRVGPSATFMNSVCARWLVMPDLALDARKAPPRHCRMPVLCSPSARADRNRAGVSPRARASGYKLTVGTAMAKSRVRQSRKPAGSAAHPGHDGGSASRRGCVIAELYMGRATSVERRNEHRQTLRSAALRRAVRLPLLAWIRFNRTIGSGTCAGTSVRTNCFTRVDLAEQNRRNPCRRCRTYACDDVIPEIVQLLSLLRQPSPRQLSDVQLHPTLHLQHQFRVMEEPIYAGRSVHVATRDQFFHCR